MNGQKITEEFAKNFDAEVSISCTNCQKVYKLAECLREEQMPPPYETVLEGFLVCPSCGDRKHSYYLSEYVRFQQTRLTKALQRYNETRSSKDWNTYRSIHNSFKLHFDKTQKKYKEIFGKETAVEPGG